MLVSGVSVPPTGPFDVTPYATVADSTRVAEPTVELDVVASMASSRDYVASIDAVKVAV